MLGVPFTEPANTKSGLSEEDKSEVVFAISNIRATTVNIIAITKICLVDFFSSNFDINGILPHKIALNCSADMPASKSGRANASIQKESLRGGGLELRVNSELTPLSVATTLIRLDCIYFKITRKSAIICKYGK